MPLRRWRALSAGDIPEKRLNSSISIAILVVAVSFSAVIALIADLDRPQERTLTVSQQAPIDVRQSMNSLERSR